MAFLMILLYLFVISPVADKLLLEYDAINARFEFENKQRKENKKNGNSC